MASGIPSPRWGWRDTALCAGIWLLVVLVSQRWAGLDTPDSSFYASLSLFGSEVTDRAPFDSYWWTRLGFIAPNHLLTTVLGPWLGFAAYRFLLILLLVASAYVILRRFTTRTTASALTGLISLSTVPLSYLGNTYLTGSVLAGTMALIACGLSASRRAAVTAGVLLGWLVMVNPPGVLLAGTIWLAIRIHQRTHVRHLVIAAIATVITFALFWLSGRVLFPGLDWFGAYLDAQAIDLSVFASTEPVWLRDVSLLVPAGILVVTVLVWFWNRGQVSAQLGFLISATSIAFMLVFSPLMGGIALEAPMYQAMLWPPALIALALSGAAVGRDHEWSPVAWVALVLAVLGMLLAGRTALGIDFGVGVLIALVLIAACVAVLLGSAASGNKVAFAVIGVGILLVGGQLLQNARGPLGLYFLSPYSWAFTANPISDKIHTAVNAQEWLIANTTRDDRILDWVGGDWVGGDRELYVVSGMQLWGGENLVTLAPTLDEPGRAKLEAVRPSVISMVAPSMDRVMAFWSSLPPERRASAPQCYDFTWSPSPDAPTWVNPAPVTQGHSCLTRLDWSS